MAYRILATFPNGVDVETTMTDRWVRPSYISDDIFSGPSTSDVDWDRLGAEYRAEAERRDTKVIVPRNREKVLNLDNPGDWIRKDRLVVQASAVDLYTTFSFRAGLTDDSGVEYMATPAPTLTSDGYLIIQERGVVVARDGTLGKSLMVGEGKHMTNTGVLMYRNEWQDNPFIDNARTEIEEETGFTPIVQRVAGIFRTTTGVPGYKVVVLSHLDAPLRDVVEKNQEAHDVYVRNGGNDNHAQAVAELVRQNLPEDAYEGRLYGIPFNRPGMSHLLHSSAKQLSLLRPTLATVVESQWGGW